MLLIAGLVVSILYPTGHAERLYTWQDDKGVTHISQEPPPQNTNLIDIMDYMVSPATKDKAIGKQVSSEGENSQPQRMGPRKAEKAMRPSGTTDDVDEDVYYDGDGDRGRKIRHERIELRREGHDNRRESDYPRGEQQRRQNHHRE
jgi:hypothetical protein